MINKRYVIEFNKVIKLNGFIEMNDKYIKNEWFLKKKIEQFFIYKTIKVCFFYIEVDFF